ncbi:MAG: pilus assembly protein [Ramlibacter sp.]
MTLANSLRVLVAAALMGLFAAPAAQSADPTEPTQYPLLSRAPNVPPNLMLILDDSNSMDYAYVYQDRDPNKWGPTADQVSGDKRPSTDQYARCAPEVNRIAYNPDNRYDPPKNADGTFRAQGSIQQARDNPECKGFNDQPRVNRYLGDDKRYDLESSYTSYTIRPAITTYPKSAKRTDCPGSSCTYAQEIQNYANWYQYHRRRIFVATTALSQIISDAPAALRFGWASMNHLATNGTIATGVRPLGEQNSKMRTSFSTWLDGLQPDTTLPGTPSNEALHRMGQYYERKDVNGPWANDPAAGTTTYAQPASSEENQSTYASCRRAYTMMVTDGYYTDSVKDLGNVDRTAGEVHSTPSGQQYNYTPTLPYMDGHANTMADIAMHYWARDLLKNVDNNVSPVKGSWGDPAFWQHMNFLAITLGLEGSIPQTQTSLNALSAGTRAWPAPIANTNVAVDDLWHATINSRGSFINAGDSRELSNALNSLVTGILRASATQGGVAASTLNLTVGTKKFIPVYTSGQWTGNLIATELDPKTGAELRTIWQVEKADPVTGEEASNTIPDAVNRNILVGNKHGSTPAAVTFTWAGLQAAGLTTLMGTDTKQSLVAYLRGSRANEQGEDPLYRKRAFLLGDIVNSNPTVVGPAIDYGYAKLPNQTLAKSYTTYLNSKRERGEGLVFIGANDGMLHAFREDKGREVFAYVPHAVLPIISQLARKDYVHRYFVDGPTSQGDYYNGTEWRTAVIATAGAGAKSVFAIDATSNTLDASSVLWEVHTGIDAYSKILGNVLSEVQIVRLMNGIGGAVFGNGYYSADGKAQLLIVNMRTGELIKAIDTGVGDGNGLGGVHLVRNAASQVIGAYAGDLKGNLWKFHLNDPDPANWTVSREGGAGKPLFVAKDTSGNTQPITAAPLAVAHPDGGYIVVAGTGRFFDASDVSTTATQTIYGIRDEKGFEANSVKPVSGTSTLVLQTIIEKKDESRIITSFDDTTSTQTVSFYEVSVNPIDWKVKNGWYFQQPYSGQRMVYPVSRIAGRLAKVDTIVPGGLASDPCASATPGKGYNYIIDALSGGSPQGPFLDTNGDGVVDAKDVAATGYSTELDGGDTLLPVYTTSPAPACKNPPCPSSCTTTPCPDDCAGLSGTIRIAIVSTTGGVTFIEKNCGNPKPSFKRKSSWQQLFIR